MTKLNEMTYGELTEQLAKVTVEIRRRGFKEGYEQGKFDQRMDTASNAVAKIANGVGINIGETAQEKRDEIVERAKADIEALKYAGESDYEVRLGKERPPYHCTAEFIVNKNKRTVVALLKGFRTGLVRAKGIAKCAPNDCFNVHIGKAIALRRALGLEVPGEFMNAPQPTEVRVGDIVEYDTIFGKKREKVEVNGVPIRGRFHAKSQLARNGTVVDDSREGDDE